jgi:hypothetical protein
LAASVPKDGVHNLEQVQAHYLMSADRIEAIRRAINARLEAERATSGEARGVQNGVEGAASVTGKPEANKGIAGVGEGERSQTKAGNRGVVDHGAFLEAIKDKHGVTDDTVGMEAISHGLKPHPHWLEVEPNDPDA